MASELERIAGRLRFLSDQAQQHRQPVLEASRKLREAASTVHTARFDQPEDGPAITAPPHLAARLSQAADRAGRTVAPLNQTADLLRVFAARLASGGASAAGAVQPGPALDAPAGEPPPTSADVPGSPERGDRETAAATPEGAESVAPPRYGRYPTTTAVRRSPGNRSYEVRRQPQ
ncbi:hypothetical protein [Cryptosporangium japonicum]|uniref:Uncharacterized protein n=1 Tax=Cryptosporangium japonicum TaxID=80872 RepID=A0ABP3EQI0_9ACTN